MKYQLSSVKRPAKKPFDFNASVEALTETFDKIGSSYAELVAAEGRVIEVEQCMSDCQQALESISKYGLTAQNMTLLNGSDHGLDRALGLEDLAIESLASLSASHKAMLQRQYVVGLEGKGSEMLKNMVERIKTFFAKLLQWLKDVFTGNAQIQKVLENAKFDNLDPEKKITALSYDDAVAALGDIELVKRSVLEAGNSPEQFAGAKDAYNKSYEKKNDTVANLKWTTANADKVKQRLIAAGNPKAFNDAWQKIQADYKSVIAGTPQGETLRDKFDIWKTAAHVTGVYNKLYRQVGLTLVTVSKATKKSEKAAEAK